MNKNSLTGRSLRKRGLGLGVALISFCLAAPGLAADLSTAEASKFADCLPGLMSVGEELEKDPAMKILNDSVATLPLVDGELRLYSVPLERVREEAPSAYGQIDKEARTCGMGSAEALGKVGDKVIAAYIASQITPAMRAQMNQLTPEMMAMMPPQAKQSFAMVNALENVPAENIAALTPDVMKKLEVAMGTDGKNGQAPKIFGK